MGGENSVRWFTVRGNVRKLTYLLSGACCGGTSRFFWLFLNFLRIYLSPWYQRS
jgi:hypothetical protein